MNHERTFGVQQVFLETPLSEWTIAARTVSAIGSVPFHRRSILPADLSTAVIPSMAGQAAKVPFGNAVTPGGHAPNQRHKSKQPSCSQGIGLAAPAA
jgi:hypothetical protein